MANISKELTEATEPVLSRYGINASVNVQPKDGRWVISISWDGRDLDFERINLFFFKECVHRNFPKGLIGMVDTLIAPFYDLNLQELAERIKESATYRMYTLGNETFQSNYGIETDYSLTGAQEYYRYKQFKREWLNVLAQDDERILADNAYRHESRIADTYDIPIDATAPEIREALSKFAKEYERLEKKALDDYLTFARAQLTISLHIKSKKGQ